MVRQARLMLGLASVPMGMLPVFLPAAHAGSQVEEPLADAVRNALRLAIAQAAPPEPEFRSTGERLHYVRWLVDMAVRLTRHQVDWRERKEFLQTVWYEAKRAGLDPGLVLGLIQVESGFRKFVVSPVGARGYMQVMPFWSRLIGDGDPGKLFHMQTNLRFGCVILRHYIDREGGDLFMGLGRYNGSRGRPEYPNAVFAAARRWEYKDKPPEAPAGTPAPAGPPTPTPVDRGG
jgi:soluble lytic murein transglycosylase-like protein